MNVYYDRLAYHLEFQVQISGYTYTPTTGNSGTQYGLVNAVTRTSQDIDDYNRATEFEKFGGQLLDGGLDFLVSKISNRKVG